MDSIFMECVMAATVFVFLVSVIKEIEQYIIPKANINLHSPCPFSCPKGVVMPSLSYNMMKK